MESTDMRSMIAVLVARSVIDPIGCWRWGGPINVDGYGKVSWREDGRTVTRYVHRLAWEHASGAAIPDGFQVDHVCKTRNCWRPEHLRLLQAEVHAALANGEKQQCPAGHRFDGENTYRAPDGSRVCRTCRRATQRRYKARIRELGRVSVRNLLADSADITTQGVAS